MSKREIYLSFQNSSLNGGKLTARLIIGHEQKIVIPKSEKIELLPWQGIEAETNDRGLKQCQPLIAISKELLVMH